MKLGNVYYFDNEDGRNYNFLSSSAYEALKEKDYFRDYIRRLNVNFFEDRVAVLCKSDDEVIALYNLLRDIRRAFIFEVVDYLEINYGLLEAKEEGFSLNYDEKLYREHVLCLVGTLPPPPARPGYARTSKYMFNGSLAGDSREFSSFSRYLESKISERGLLEE